MRVSWLVVVGALVMSVGIEHASAQGWGRPQQAWGQPAYQQQPVYQQQQSWGAGGSGYAQPFRNFFVGAGLGFGVTFSGAHAYFRLEENVGYHLLNVDEHPGLFVALTIVQGIADQVLLDFAARVGFDAVAWQNADVRVMVTPSLGLGVGLFFANVGFGDDVFPGFFLMPGLEVAVTVARGFMTIWYRPLGFDILARDNGSAAYTMTAGVNLNLP